jgi:hypothetical protein
LAAVADCHFGVHQSAVSWTAGIGLGKGGGMAVMANLLVVVLVAVAIWKLGLLVVSMGLLLFLSFPPFKRRR